jgi:sulfide:quinone oxidoreductase
VARVEVTFRTGERPMGNFDDPSKMYMAEKSDFGTDRVRRWFDRKWTNY